MQSGEHLNASLLPVVRNGRSRAEKYAGAGKSFPEAHQRTPVGECESRRQGITIPVW
jgi:hypothetical protein